MSGKQAESEAEIDVDVQPGADRSDPVGGDDGADENLGLVGHGNGSENVAQSNVDAMRFATQHQC